jgi:uncharacterized spore protein YtfJ
MTDEKDFPQDEAPDEDDLDADLEEDFDEDDLDDDFDEDDFDEEDLDDYEEVGERDPVAAIQDTLESFLSTADVEAAYGETIINGDTLIIPTAEVLAVLGIGMGSGYGSGGDREGQNPGEGGGSGGGGGGRVFSRPVAVVIASPEGVRVEPVVDVTKIVLAFLTAFGFMFTLLGRMRSPRRSLTDN